MYDFITYCGQERKVTTATRARKIISIRHFWKYLKTKAHLLSNNIAEELESPKLPQRMPKYLTLEESIRLLIESEKSPRDYCILTIFLNCALRLSELVNLNVEQIENDTIQIIGKGNKERRIFLTATTMFKYGHVDVRTLQVLLGHSNLNTTMIYTAVDNDQLQSTVNSNPLANMFGR